MQNQQAITYNKEAKPIISFIITYFNIPLEMLSECIESILALPLHKDEREIIIIDDGSKTKLDDFKSKFENGIIIVRQENKGLSEARNTGLTIAKGQYIQFVDGDDALLKRTYSSCLNAINKQQQPDMIVFNLSNEKFQSAGQIDFRISDGTEYMLKNNIRASACGYIFKKSMLGEHRFTSKTYHEDEEFTPILLLKAKQIYITDSPAYWYRERDNSITTSCNIEKLHKRLNDKEQVIIRLNRYKENITDSKQIDALSRRISQLSMDYLYNIIVDTNSWEELIKRKANLKNIGLFPLPNKKYTIKYRLFRHLTNNHLGLKLLFHLTPLMKKER